jgi:hypothetical protein
LFSPFPPEPRSSGGIFSEQIIFPLARIAQTGKSLTKAATARLKTRDAKFQKKSGDKHCFCWNGFVIQTYGE